MLHDYRLSTELLSAINRIRYYHLNTHISNLYIMNEYTNINNRVKQMLDVINNVKKSGLVMLQMLNLIS